LDNTSITNPLTGLPGPIANGISNLALIDNGDPEAQSESHHYFFCGGHAFRDTIVESPQKSKVALPILDNFNGGLAIRCTGGSCCRTDYLYTTDTAKPNNDAWQEGVSKLANPEIITDTLRSKEARGRYLATEYDVSTSGYTMSRLAISEIDIVTGYSEVSDVSILIPDMILPSTDDLTVHFDPSPAMLQVSGLYPNPLTSRSSAAMVDVSTSRATDFMIQIADGIGRLVSEECIQNVVGKQTLWFQSPKVTGRYYVTITASVDSKPMLLLTAAPLVVVR
jgi:hypothetical protein